MSFQPRHGMAVGAEACRPRPCWSARVSCSESGSSAARCVPSGARFGLWRRRTPDKDEERLHSYGWVDRKAGTVQVPIERAMQMLVEKQKQTPKGEAK